MNRFILILIIAISMVSCIHDSGRLSHAEDYVRVSQDFNADSAYNFIAAQVAFGPRVPNTEAHVLCKNYLVAKLTEFGAVVQIQETEVIKYSSDRLHIFNIIATINPDAAKRILLMAHWDTRFMADMDADANAKNQPIPGANDGAGGVGVLLEVARQLQAIPPGVGVDIVLFDAEDQGEPNSYRMETWCLGSTYWSKNLHTPGYKAEFGVLLDMATGFSPLFTRESNSMHYAPDVTTNVWLLAERCGYNKYFSFEETHFVGIDDHVPVNVNAKIPVVAIIQYNDNNKSFADYWHTHNDSMDAVSKETVKMVGQVLLELIYTEKK